MAGCLSLMAACRNLQNYYDIMGFLAGIGSIKAGILVPILEVKCID